MINLLLAIIIALAIYITIFYVIIKKKLEVVVKCLVKNLFDNIDVVIGELQNKHNISCESERDILRFSQVITIKIPLNKLDDLPSIITEQMVNR